MVLPQFLLADNTDLPEKIFVVHTQFPSFVIDLEDSKIEFLEEIDEKDLEEIGIDIPKIIQDAEKFYDREVALYNSENG